MRTHPSADELLVAVKLFLERIAPQLQDRDVFLARVSVNAIGVVRRELDLGPRADAAAMNRLAAILGRTGDLAALEGRLSALIREGAFDQDEEALLDHLRLSAMDAVEIDQPGYSGLRAARAVNPAGDGSANG